MLPSSRGRRTWSDCCTQIETIDGPVPLTEKKKKEILDANGRMASRALRVLAMALPAAGKPFRKTSVAEMEKECIFLGLRGYRPGKDRVAPAVAKARESGTPDGDGDRRLPGHGGSHCQGDRPRSTPGGLVLTGAELDRMSDEELAARADRSMSAAASHRRTRLRRSSTPLRLAARSWR